MISKDFIEKIALEAFHPRGQSTLLPESFDDYVSDTNSVCIVDGFVDELDLVNLGFDGAVPADTGRPAYHPEVLLKIYIDG